MMQKAVISIPVLLAHSISSHSNWTCERITDTRATELQDLLLQTGWSLDNDRSKPPNKFVYRRNMSKYFRLGAEGRMFDRQSDGIRLYKWVDWQDGGLELAAERCGKIMSSFLKKRRLTLSQQREITDLATALRYPAKGLEHPLLHGLTDTQFEYWCTVVRTLRNVLHSRYTDPKTKGRKGTIGTPEDEALATLITGEVVDRIAALRELYNIMHRAEVDLMPRPSGKLHERSNRRHEIRERMGDLSTQLGSWIADNPWGSQLAGKCEKRIFVLGDHKRRNWIPKFPKSHEKVRAFIEENSPLLTDWKHTKKTSVLLREASFMTKQEKRGKKVSFTAGGFIWTGTELEFPDGSREGRYKPKGPSY